MRFQASILHLIIRKWQASNTHKYEFCNTFTEIKDVIVFVWCRQTLFLTEQSIKSSTILSRSGDLCSSAENRIDNGGATTLTILGNNLISFGNRHNVVICFLKYKLHDWRVILILQLWCCYSKVLQSILNKRDLATLL